ncbi:hypothetical protein KCU99_g2822, partial [Aureobasidium melanogenum]
MNQSPTLPVPPFSRPRGVSRYSSHNGAVDSEEHPTATSQEPLLSQTDVPNKVSQPKTIPQIHAPIPQNTDETHGKFSKALEWLGMTWYIEMFSLLCSTACAALIIAFLAIHDNTPINSWHFYFSINTIVSTLGVVFKTTLLMAVSAALAQGKWTWFQKRNGPLSTFVAIDAASSNIFESFKLLWRVRGQHSVSAGALVIALGLVIDPFLQAIISDYGVLVDLDASIQNNTKATIGKSNRFDGGTQCISTWPSRYPQIDTTPDFAVAAAMYDGLNAALSHDYQNVSFTCTSGNCTWTGYTSLAVRSTCFDISSFLKRMSPENAAKATATTQTSLSMSSEFVTVSIDTTSMSQQLESYGEESSNAYSDTSIPNSEAASTQSIATQVAVTTPTGTPQLASYGEALSNSYSDTSTTDSEVAPTQSVTLQATVATPQLGYSAPPLLTVLSAFSDVSTVNSEVASVQSIVTQATSRLDRRVASSVQSSQSQPQSSARWTDWTLEHLGLRLSNTNEAWRNASTFAVLQAAVVADPNRTINFVASQALLAAFTIIRTDNTHSLGSAAWDAANASAMECGLELTLNVYNSSVKNNVLVENIVASASKKVPGSWLPSPNIDQSGVDPNKLPVDRGTPESNPIYHHMFLYRDDYALDPTALQSSANENFTVPQNTLVSTLDFLTSLIRQNNDNGTVKAVLQQDQSNLYTYGSAVLQPLFNQTNTTATFDAIARSMSNAIRNAGKEPMSGTTQQWVRYYQVRWAFLTLPLSLLTIGTVFFILSVIDAHEARIPSWKNNGMATMIHGPDEMLRQDLRAKAFNHSLGVAGETMAKLEWFDQGYALTAANAPVAENFRPTTPARDEEEHEMCNMKIPTTPQTPGSNITLVDSPSVGGGSDQGTIRSVSPVHNGHGWSDVQLDDSSTSLSIRRSL